MADLKARWLSLIDKYSAEPAALAPKSSRDTVFDSVSADVATEELPIYEATPAQINYWHAFGANIFLQQILCDYDLDFFYNVGEYNRYKIGYDKKAHRATFAIDDTHYYAIPFDTYDASPLNYSVARLVLEKINQLAEARC